jgi:Zn-dependent protease/predicted transcriptional regulator
MLAGFSQEHGEVATKSARAELMPASVRLGRVGGIPIGLHYTWFIIAALITFSLAGRFRETHPPWDTVTVWSVAVLTAVLFFATLLAHELSHAVVARARGLPVRSITLFALGGLANIEKDATSAKTEFLVAIVGPIVSFAIGFTCIGLAQSMGWSIGNGAAGITGSVLGWLGSINVVLAIFNLIPGYPLDGGRILRALLWGIYKDADRATRTAARIGQGVAGVFIALGLLQFFLGAGFGGLWLAFIGWFLLMAAQASYAEVSIAEALRNVRVGDVMANDCVTVDPQVTVQGLVDDVLLRTGRRCVMVKRDGRVLGLVTPNEVRAVDRARWSEVTAGDVMRPLSDLRTVDPETPVSEALKVMAREDVNQLPVVSDDHLEGMVSRAHILQLLQSRAELKAS